MGSLTFVTTQPKINILQTHITTIQIVPYNAYGTDLWNNNILSNFIIWTQLTLYVPKVSHNTFDVSGYDIYLLYYTILHPVPHKYHLYLLISWPLEYRLVWADAPSFLALSPPRCQPYFLHKFVIRRKYEIGIPPQKKNLKTGLPTPYEWAGNPCFSYFAKWTQKISTSSYVDLPIFNDRVSNPMWVSWRPFFFIYFEEWTRRI